MCNAFDIGIEYERDRCIQIAAKLQRLGCSAEDVAEEIIASAKS
jgi:hypothetical protein